MKINATLTTESGSWNQAKKHVDRNWKHDKNEDSVDKSLSKFNLHDKYETINWTDDRFKIKLLKFHYSKFVQERNAHFCRQGHPKRQQTVSNYLKGKTTTELGIATAGTMNNKIDMKLEINQAYSNRSRAENNRRYYQASSWALKRYVCGFNKRNPYCPIYHWWTNVDELGAPHVHFAMVPLGYTKLDKKGRPKKATMEPYKSGKRKGQMHRVTGSKPTGDLTRAIEMQFGTNNRRKAFKAWNDQETKAIVRDFGATFQQRFSKVEDWDTPFERQHTGRKGSLSMKSYKATWDKFDQIERKQDQRKRKQDHRKMSLDSRELSLNNRERAFVPKAKAYKHYSNRLPSLISENHSLSVDNNDLKIKNKELVKSNNSLDSEISDKRKLVNVLDNRQDRLNRNIELLQRKYNSMKRWLHKKWTVFKNKHLSGLYNGLAIGIHYFYPKFNMKACERFATGESYVYWGKDKSTRKSGIPLFIKGLTDNSKSYYKNMKSVKNVSKSFGTPSTEDYKRGAQNYIPNGSKDNDVEK